MKENYFSKWRETLSSAKYYNYVVLITGLIIYLIFSTFLDKSVNVNFMFDRFNPNADSFSYLQVGEWILGGKPSEHSAFRPFLFPVIVASLYKLGGIYLIWIFQILAYILGHYFLHKGVEEFTKNRRLAWAASLLYLINFSLIGLTYHGLTEVITVLGLSGILYLTVLNIKEKISSGDYWGWAVLIFGLLTLIKPVFINSFYICLVLVLLHLLFKKVSFNQLLKWPIVVAFVGIIVQMFVLKAVVGEYGISEISGKTYKSYLLTQAIMNTEEITKEEAKEKAYDMNPEEIVTYSMENFGCLSTLFFDNLRTNIRSDSFVQDYNHGENNRIPAKIMQNYNRTSYYIYIFILLFGVYYFLSRMKKYSFFSAIALAMIWVVLLYYVFVTGISFDQRDRLVIGVLPLWIYFFIVFGQLFVQRINQFISRKKSRTTPIIE
jgi:hypothetical protein